MQKFFCLFMSFRHLKQTSGTVLEFEFYQIKLW